MILQQIRKFKKSISIFVLIIFFNTIIPVSIFAITSGPAQEEFTSFEAAQSTEMVNLYSGDFTYNIPLMNIPGPNGGYPINLFYNAGTNINEAGSWVGLGWNLNIGAVNRQLRGIPDDFNGEEIKQEMHLKKSFSVGLKVPKNYRELGGVPQPLSNKPNLEVYYNNYKGLGYRISASHMVENHMASYGVGLSYDSQNGIGIDPSLGLTLKGKHQETKWKLDLSTSYNSRNGLENIAFSHSREPILDKNDSGVVAIETRMGISGSSKLSFGFNGSVPSVNVPVRSTNINFDLKFGKADIPFYFDVARWGNWEGHVNWSKLQNGGVDVRKAYGYLHNEKDIFRNGLKDFSRGNIHYSKKIPNLASSSFTYDQLLVTGAGIGGMFRPYRSMVEILNSPLQESVSKGHEINIEFGTGSSGATNNFHIGAGYSYTKGDQYSGIWKNESIDEVILDPNSVNAENTSGEDYQPYRYKLFGEQTGRYNMDADQLEAWKEDTPIRVDLEKETEAIVGKSFVTTNEFVNEKIGASADLPVPPNGSAEQPVYVAREKRTPQANSIQTLTARQAKNYGFSKDLNYYNVLGNPISKFGDEVDDSDKISEIIVNKNDGSRYVYGLPAENIKQVDATFNVYPTYNLPGGGTAEGGSNLDVVDQHEVTNDNASDQYSSKKTMPGYAHSWLLTHIVSSDYMDRTGDGFTNDDPGSWMKFDYKKTADGYRWREPYQGSSFIEGSKGDPSDDMASYVYGEKELYYLYKVETPTHQAVFETKDRNDAIGVINEENGGIDQFAGINNKMQRLDNIKLYVKEDGMIPLGAVPIQTIQFNHGYSLCSGIPSSNSSSGKLTLNEVFVKTDHSIKGELSPYKFSYASNPNFNRRDRDRWGNYQKNIDQYGDEYPFIDFPYTDQYSPPVADAWQLKSITLPTGGIIEVDYESDDYAYEMDKPAVQMFDIVDQSIGIVHNRFEDGNEHNSLNNVDNDGNYKVYVNLTTPIPSGVDQGKYFLDHYLKGIDHVYYKAFINLLGDSDDDKDRDYVAGYAKLLKENATQYGVLASNPSVAFITVEKVKVQKPAFGQYIHPFQRAALEHLKSHRSELVYGTDVNEVDPGNFLDQIVNTISTVGNFIQEALSMQMGFYRYGTLQGWGDRIYLNGKSIIRLNNGTGFMYGGGNRVKEIRLSNEWGNGAGADEYGQQFDYTLEEDGRTISSGVAITPQSAGADECALLKPVQYEHSSPLVSPYSMFVEEPFMRMYHPGPGVGYRKVTVKSLADKLVIPGNNTIKKSLAPITEYEFYTHKDFPVIENHTDLSSASPAYTVIPIPIVGSILKKEVARSQGYVVELNNMAGVQKMTTQKTYPTAENPEGTLIARTEYIYHTKEGSQNDVPDPTKLSSEVKFIDPGTGAWKDGTIGVEYDIFHDFHENSSKSTQAGLNLNLDLAFIQGTPFPGITFFPELKFNETATSIRTAVTNKIIYRTGILKEVKVTDGLATITTENVAFERETAQPVLTKTTNEFKDNIYSLSEPAHWYYDKQETGSMAGAYKNIGITVSNVAASNGVISLQPDQVAYFYFGDELWTENETTGQGMKVYVNGVTPNSNSISCIDMNGASPSWENQDITIIRSGRRNILSASSASMAYKGTFGATDLEDYAERDNNVLNTAATTFDNLWQSQYCNNYYTSTEAGCNTTATGNDLSALFNQIANPNFPSPGQNDLTVTHDLTPGYDPFLTTNILTEFNILDPDLWYNYLSTNSTAHILVFTLSANNCNYCPPCLFRLIEPTSDPFFNWENVTVLNNLQATSVDEFTMTAYIFGQPFEVIGSNACYEVGECTSGGFVLEECDDETVGNTFTRGEKTWRPEESYVYKNDRDYASGIADLRSYDTYAINPINWNPPTNFPVGWIRASTVTKYSPHGNVLEEKDALENYAASQYGYQKQLAVAVASNAKCREIGFDGFEDYDKDCTDHFRFPNPGLVTGPAHTGDKSIFVPLGEEAYPSMIRLISQENHQTSCNCTFDPIPEKKYILSAWVKETLFGEDLYTTTSYTGSEIEVQFTSENNGPAGTYNFLPSGKIIDGWQRIYGEFDVPYVSNTDNLFIEVKLKNTSNANAVYVDDIRIHPFESNMQSFVYNAKNLRLMATLDENNFATFLIRDQEGQVVKYSAETEKGIVTLREGSRFVKPN